MGCWGMWGLASWKSGVTMATAGAVAMSLAGVAAAPASARSDGGHGFGRMGPANARTTTVSPTAGPDFELPFLCGQRWTGSTRSGHSPSSYTVDFNAPNDYRKPVLASAPGVVTKVVSLTSSYGRYLIIDHGAGYTTLYAHLDRHAVTVGTVVDQGDLVGYLGTTGNSTGPHLHFEQRRNGAYFAPYFHRTRFRMGSTVSSANCTDRPVTGDWDGNGTTEIGIARSTASTLRFYRWRSTIQDWGSASAAPAVGDYDGDGVSQVGIRGRGLSNWYLRSASGAVAKVAGVGAPDDIPVVGDWDGNGRDNLGYYRSSSRIFYLRGEDHRLTAVALGSAGDRPVVGDWNGDGVTDLGVYKDGWFSLRVPSGSGHTLERVTFGLAGDLPIAGDWNGDGYAEVGVWRPGTAAFYLRNQVPGSPPGKNTYVRWGLPR